MATREKIREGIGSCVRAIRNDRSPQVEALFKAATDNILAYLHSQGVVIRADRELPAISWSSSDPRYDQAYSRGIAKGISMAKEAGYVATIPLVEE